MTPDPFPSELVEAAAKAIYESANLAPAYETLPLWHADMLRRAAQDALAAVLPRIEQRVIAEAVAILRADDGDAAEEWADREGVSVAEACACMLERLIHD